MRAPVLRALVACALLAGVPALALAAPTCTDAADERVRACRRWDPEWPGPGQAPFRVQVRVAEGVGVGPEQGVSLPDEYGVRPPRAPGTPVPQLPGVPPALEGENNGRAVLLALNADAVLDWPPGSGDVTVWGFLVVGRDFVPVFARVQWVDGNRDAVPDAVAVQGPFALVTPVAV